MIVYSLISSALYGPNPAKLHCLGDFAALTGRLIELEFNEKYINSEISLHKCMN